jgi:hypothetical protein
MVIEQDNEMEKLFPGMELNNTPTYLQQFKTCENVPYQ